MEDIQQSQDKAHRVNVFNDNVAMHLSVHRLRAGEDPNSVEPFEEVDCAVGAARSERVCEDVHPQAAVVPHHVGNETSDLYRNTTS